MTEWIGLLPAILVAAIMVIVPGLIVVLVAVPLRLPSLAVAPAVSVAIFGLSALVCGAVGWRWNTLAVVVTTALVAAAVWLLRRWLFPDKSLLPKDESPLWPPMGRAWWWAGGGLAVAGGVLTKRVIDGVGAPSAISQSFDATFHLNVMRRIAETGNGSIFGLRDFTGNPYYPLGWHNLGALVSDVTGTSVVQTTHAVNIVLAGLVWTLGCAALGAAFFPRRPWAPGAAAILGTGFGAFPLRLLEHGVVYPNFLVVSLLPGVLALVATLLFPSVVDASEAQATDGRGGWRHWLIPVALLVTAIGGLTLAHPNGFYSLLAMSTPLWLWVLGRQVVRKARAGNHVSALLTGGVGVALLIVTTVFWWLTETSAVDGDIWADPIQNTSEAVGEVLRGSPGIRGPAAFVVGALILVGLAAIVMRPTRWYLAGPFVVASGLFIVASALQNQTLRLALTGVYYTDYRRVAALVPIGAIIVMLAGMAGLTDLFKADAQRTERTRWRWFLPACATVAALALVHQVAWRNPNTIFAVGLVHDMHTTGHLLTTAERELLTRLPEFTDADGLIGVNPGTGAALAYALAGRQVTEPHIYAAPSDAELFVAANLQHINTDPAVCEAVVEAGITYVLDFGTQLIYTVPDASDYSGYAGILPGPHLTELLRTGPEASLWRVDC